MVPTLLLKDWHCLSDEALEDELRERDSFRRFCGFRAADQIPDHTTICRFRNDLAPPTVPHSNRHATPRSRRQRTSPSAPRPRPSSLHALSPSFLRRQELATSSVGTRSPTPTAHPSAARRRVARWSTTLRRSCLRRNDGERECDGHAAWVIEAGAIWCAGSLPSTPHLTSPLVGGGMN